MRSLALALLGGCSFSHGMLVAGDDAPADSTQLQSDGPVDAAPSCLAKWHDGTIQFGIPVDLMAMSSTSYDRDPSVSADELTFWISSSRTGTIGGADVFQATRATKSSAWSTPMSIPPISSTGTETKFSVTADGLYGVVGSDRTGSVNGSLDVWEATRATPDGAWSAPLQTHLGKVNTGGADHDPTISGDGLRLYLAPQNGIQAIQVATRASRGDNFETPVTITELYSGYGDGDPALSADEQIIAFSSNRPATRGGSNIWYAVRTSMTAAWSAPLPLDDLNTDGYEGDPTLSSDGCRVYFARDVGSGNWDIMLATAL